MKTWLKSLAAAVIGGAATAGTSCAGFALAASSDANVHALNFHELGILMLSGAVTSGLFYLKKSPLPDDALDPVPATKVL